MSFEMTAIAHSQFTITRYLHRAVRRAFAAWSDPKAKRAWFVDHDGAEWETLSYDLDFRVGGREAGAFLKDGKVLHEIAITFLDIMEERRIVFAYSMALDRVRHSASLATVELTKTYSGCTLIYTEHGVYFAGSDGAAGRQSGWEWLLSTLEKELEAR